MHPRFNAALGGALALGATLWCVWCAPHIAGVSPVRACDLDQGPAAGSVMGAHAEDDDCPNFVVHGQAGVGAVAEFFMELTALDPGYQPVWEGALDWVVATAEPQIAGVAWPWSYCDGVSQELAFITTNWNAELLTRGYLMNGDASYLPTIDAALQYVDAGKQSLLQDTCFWLETIPSHNFNFGALWGVASFVKYNVEIYRATGNTTAESLAHCAGQTLVIGWADNPLGEHWGHSPTPFCGGFSGIIEALVELDRTFGATNPEYGTTAKAALDYLILQADDSEPGYKWGWDPENPSAANTSVGGGVAGVGRAFLAGYEQFGDPDYFTYAKGAADWLIYKAEQPAPGVFKWADPAGAGQTAYRTNFCRGAAGISHFLYDVNAAGGSQLYKRAAINGAKFLASNQVSTPDGPVMVDKEGSDQVSTDFAWGLAGLVNPIWQPAGGFINTSPLREVVVNAADWFIANKLENNGEISWFYTYGVSGSQPLPASSRGPVSDLFDVRLFANYATSSYDIEVRFDAELPSSVSEMSYQVFDVGGRQVSDGRFDVSRSVDTVEFQWDARDRSGRLLPRGAYVMRVRAGQLVEELKVAVLR